MKKLSLLFAALALLATPVAAQTTNGKVTTTAPTYTTNSFAPLSLNTSGGLRVECVTGCGGGGGGGGTSSTFGAAMPSAGTAAGFQSSGGTMAPLILKADGSIPATEYVTRVTPTDNVSLSNAMGRFQDSSGNFSYLGVLPQVYDTVGNNLDMLRGNSNGLYVNGPGAVGAAPVGNPLYMGGFSAFGSGEIVPINVDDDGIVYVNTSTYAISGSPPFGSNTDIVGGFDGTNAQRFRTDTNGNQYVVLKDGSNNVIPFNPNGQASDANSSPVVITSDQMGLDGTTITTTPGSALNAVLFTTPTKGYSYLTVTPTSIGSGNTLRFQYTDDGGVTWSNAGSIGNYDGAAVWASAQGPSVGAVYSIPAIGSQMRAIISVYGSGTVAVNATLHTETFNLPMTDNVSPRYTARTTSPGSASNGTPTTPIIDSGYKIVVTPLAIPEMTWGYVAASAGIVNTTTAVTLAPATASLRNYLDSCQLSAEALGAATTIVVRDGAAGTVLWRSRVGTSGLPMSSVNFEPALRGSTNTLMEFATETASVTGAVYASCQGHLAP